MPYSFFTLSFYENEIMVSQYADLTPNEVFDRIPRYEPWITISGDELYDKMGSLLNKESFRVARHRLVASAQYVLLTKNTLSISLPKSPAISVDYEGDDEKNEIISLSISDDDSVIENLVSNSNIVNRNIGTKPSLPLSPDLKNNNRTGGNATLFCSKSLETVARFIIRVIKKYIISV